MGRGRPHTARHVTMRARSRASIYARRTRAPSADPRSAVLSVATKRASPDYRTAPPRRAGRVFARRRAPEALPTMTRYETYAHVAELPLIIERCELQPMVRDTTSGFTKVSIVVRLSGGDHVGEGEDITWDQIDQIELLRAGGDLSWLHGTRTFDEFSQLLALANLFPVRPIRESAHYYRRWALAQGRGPHQADAAENPLTAHPVGDGGQPRVQQRRGAHARGRDDADRADPSLAERNDGEPNGERALTRPQRAERDLCTADRSARRNRLVRAGPRHGATISWLVESGLSRGDD